jgi:hypothetical protein
MREVARIHSVLQRARRRLRVQAALERAATASILGVALAVVTTYLYRVGVLGGAAAAVGLTLAIALPAGAAALGLATRPSTAQVAARVDRASGLADRLGTACDFAHQLAGDAIRDPQTRELMVAAIDDALRHLPRADVAAAAPFRPPRDARAAAAFATVGLVIAALSFPPPGAGSGSAAASLAIADRPLAVEPPPLRLDEDDLFYSEELLDDLGDTAAKTGDEHLEAFVDDVKKLLERARRGEIGKEQLLKELAKREQDYMRGAEQDIEASFDELRQTGNQLKANPLTRELGKALERGDLERAKQELEQLAQKLEDASLSDKEREQLAESLDRAADQFDKREAKREQAAERDLADRRDQVRRLQKQLEHETDPDKRAEERRRLEKKERELEQLERREQDRREAAQTRHLKQLHRNLRETAKDLRREDGQDGQRQASRRMKDLQRDTGAVQDEARKVANQRTVASQMGDLKDALRRARQRGGNQRDQFGKNNRDRDFGRRAQGQRGDGEAWRRDGNRGGQQPGGQQAGGQQPGDTSQWGTEDGGDPLGLSTPKSGNTVDEQLSGVHGRGPSTRETILSAAQKGFASRAYQKVYADYKAVIEEVMRSEKVPSGYKYYVKRYFQEIKPRTQD